MPNTGEANALSLSSCELEDECRLELVLWHKDGEWCTSEGTPPVDEMGAFGGGRDCDGL